MGLGPRNDPRQVRVLTIRHRPIVAPLLCILPLGSLLLPLFLERLLAYPLCLGRPRSICHPLYFKASAAARERVVANDGSRRPTVTPVAVARSRLRTELFGNLSIRRPPERLKGNRRARSSTRDCDTPFWARH